jgi:regulatory protein
MLAAMREQQEERRDQSDRRAAKRTKPVTAESLDRLAAFYLERYAASEAKLRGVLRRRIDRANRFGAPLLEDAPAAIEKVLEKYRRMGALDDERYAASRARSLRGKGESARRIQQRLAQAGVGKLAQPALAALREESGESADESDFRAAVELARRRRLGPFGPEQGRQVRRERDLASLGRAGFALGVARRVIDAATSDALEELLAEQGEGR